jgi:hypothetical protein
MSDSNRTTLRFDPGTESAGGTTGGEDSPGVLNATPAFQDVKITSDSIKADTTIARSRQIVADRQISDIARTDRAVSGDIGMEMSGAMWDSWLCAVVQGVTFTGETTLNLSDITFTAPDTIATAAGDFTAVLDPSPGDWIYIAGSAGNTGFWKVNTVVALTMTTVQQTIATESSGPSIDFDKGGHTTNGTVSRTYSIEKEYADLSTEFELNLGCAIDAFTLNTNVRNIVEGSWTIQGITQSSDVSSAEGGGGPIAAPDNSVFNAVDDVSALFEADGVTLTTRATQFSFTINNNHRALPVIGTLGQPAGTGPGVGSFNCTGRFQAYFDDKAIIDKYLAFTASSFALAFNDSAGNGYVFDFPAIRYTSGQRVIPGQDDDVLMDMEWEAFKDPASAATGGQIMVRIAKFTGLPTVP